ncbi:MAG: hypothetical protein A2341_03600 [Deltaproteobacteria bacterium RIFOXYB12_FULL_58_9]|nr:MAG: hypothetical protein A2341_03600 [Deltaproteobacteria bacterium RIFOXYB12_FULL_58_9]
MYEDAGSVLNVQCVLPSSQVRWLLLFVSALVGWHGLLVFAHQYFGNSTFILAMVPAILVGLVCGYPRVWLALPVNSLAFIGTWCFVHESVGEFFPGSAMGLTLSAAVALAGGRLHGLVVKATMAVKRLETEIAIRKQRETELQAARDEVDTLHTLIPICMHCRKVRDDGQIWSRLEDYLVAHTSSKLSHGLCPECLAKHYPE